MKLENKESNYSACVVSIKSLLDLDGLDRLNGIPLFGMQALVSMDYQVGDMGIFFPTECQLSVDFARENNLHRHSNLNADETQTGYLEDNRRVRAIKFRGNNSNALFMPLNCLEYLGIDTSDLKDGESFTHVNGKEICRKYINKQHRASGQGNKTKGKTKKFVRIDNKMFPEHWSTDNFWRNEDRYHPFDIVTITQKLHGTSARFTNQRVLRKLTWKDRIAKLLGVSVNEYEWDTLSGSRRVVKDLKVNSNNQHYYETNGNLDIWNEWLEKIKHVIPKGYVIYGEIVGYIGEKQIQKNYTYNCRPGTNDLYVYRVTFVNDDGIVFDMPWDQIMAFCDNNGLNYTPELWRGKFLDFNSDDWMNKGYYQEGYANAIPLSEKSPCDEGVCVRKESHEPYVTKAKSPDFLNHETKQIDSGQIDMESDQ